jgi:general secretion pathway protein G
MSRLTKRILIATGAAIGVISIALSAIIAPILFGQYTRSIRHTKEARLHQDLFVMRQAIDQFTMDRNAMPEDLKDLVRANYLKEVPQDPFTGFANWSTVRCDTTTNPDQTISGICDVHSIANGSSPFESTAYNSW